MIIVMCKSSSLVFATSREAYSGRSLAPKSNLLWASAGALVASASDTGADHGIRHFTEEFDWEAYIAYHPDVFNAGITTEEAAKEHYLLEGQAEGLLSHRLNVVLRYTACTGLINQIYSHISAISLGIVLGAEIVLPPASIRDSFANYFSVFKDRNEVEWSPVPLTELLDEDAIIAHWKQQGVVIHKAEELQPFPDLTQPQTAFVMYPTSLAEGDCSVQLHNMYSSIQDLEDLIAEARQLIVEKAEALESDNLGRKVDTIVLDLPCTFFMLRTASNKRLVSTVARSLMWSPKVQALADKVIKGIRSSREGNLFNTLHLRIEKDARDWVQTMGGAQALWNTYMDTMRQAQFEGNTDVYIASGLLTYGADEDLAEKIEELKLQGLCKEAHYKELYLAAEEVKGLNSEQKALVDFLVLKEGHRFVGFGTSTFSFYIREIRHLEGVPLQRSQLVDASAIGTDEMFAKAATLS